MHQRKRVCAGGAEGPNWTMRHCAIVAMNMCEQRKYNVRMALTAFQVWSQIWDHSPHHYVVFSHNFVSFGRKIKVNIDLETAECDTSI